MSKKVQQSKDEFEEKVQPGIFHIHVDSRSSLNDKFDLFNIIKEDLNFFFTNFSGHPEGHASITTPNPHMTLKLNTLREFEAKWEELVKVCKQYDFAGYLEGEIIPIDEIIQFREYLGGVSPTFKLITRPLRGPPKDEFRETEVHLVMDADKSDPRVIVDLLKAGFSGAYMQKTRGDIKYQAIVLTAQGSRKEVFSLVDLLRDYLAKVDGVVRGTIKVEKVLKYKLFHMDHTHLPHILADIKYTE